MASASETGTGTGTAPTTGGAKLILAGGVEKRLDSEAFATWKAHCGLIRAMTEDDDDPEEEVVIPLPGVRPQDFDLTTQFFSIKPHVNDYIADMEKIPMPVAEFSGELRNVSFFVEHPEYLPFAENFRHMLFDPKATKPDFGLYQCVANYLDVGHLITFFCFLWALAIEMRQSFKELVVWLTGQEQLELTKEEEARMQDIFLQIAKRGPYQVPPAPTVVMNGGVRAEVATEAPEVA